MALKGELKIPRRVYSTSWYDRILKVFLSHPENILFQDDDVSLSGTQCETSFSLLINKIADTVPEGGKIGLCLPNSTSLALSLLAVIASGRVPVILNPRFSSAAFRRRLESLNLHGLFLPENQNMGADLDFPVLHVSPLAQIVYTFNGNATGTSPITSEKTALILYTSGCSGEPKGVALSHEGLTYTIDHLIKYFELNTSSVAATILPLYHTMALNTQFLPTFFAGGKNVLSSSEMGAGRVYRNIVTSCGNFIALVADLLTLCAEEKKLRNVPPAKNVKDVQLAGGSIREDHLILAQELFPGARVHKGYGLTEAIRVSMIRNDDPMFLTDSVGKVLPGQQLEIRDDEGYTVRHGDVGQIYVKGPNVMLGYEGTTKDSSSDDFLATQDLGWRNDEGYLFVKGRRDSVFKSHGRSIDGAEIERIALETFHVSDAKVIPVRCHHKGLRPILFLQTSDTHMSYFEGEGKNTLEQYLMQNLETFKIPRDIFVLPILPRNSNGKISRVGLELLWNRREEAAELGSSQRGCKFWGDLPKEGEPDPYGMALSR